MRGKKFIFTKEQEQFLIDNWHKYTIHHFKKIFKCSWYAVDKKAKELNLVMKIEKGWTSEEEEQLARLSTKYHYQEIANKLGRSKDAIYLKARKMGLSLIQDRRKWTKYDEKELRQKWGKKPIEQIAREMGRSVNSLRVKGIRMKLGALIEADLDIIRISEIEEYVGISRDAIMRFYQKGMINLEIKMISKKKGIYYVEFDELLKFLENNQHIWDSNNLEPHIFGLEPEWLINKRKKDAQNPPNLYRKWTKEEKELAKSLLLGGYNHQQIAERLNRSKEAVQYELSKRLLAYRLEHFWKGNEIKKMQELARHKTAKELSEILGRSEKAIKYKAKELNLEIKGSGHKRWTTSEERQLKELLKDHCYQEVAKIMGRSEVAIYMRAKKLDISLRQVNKIWTKEDEEMLEKDWGTIGLEQLTKKIGKSSANIREKANEMKLGAQLGVAEEMITISDIEKWIGISRAKIKVLEKEGLICFDEKQLSKLRKVKCITFDKLLEFLKNNQDVWDSRKLAKKTFVLEPKWLKEKRERDIVNPPNLNGRWTEEEIELLKKTLEEGHNYEQVEKKLGRSKTAVQVKVNKMKLKIKGNQNKRWTISEEKQLEELLKGHHCLEVAKIMGRSEYAIYLKAKKLNLPILPNYKKWKKEDEMQLEEKWGTKAIEKLAKELGRTVGALRTKAWSMKLGGQLEADGNIMKISDIEKYIGISRSRIETLEKNGLICLKKKKITKSKKTKCIETKDLLEFLKNNQDIWDSRRLTDQIFVVEPDWLKEKIERDRKNPPIQKKRWTETERNLARTLLLAGHDYEQIGNRLERTKGSVRRELINMLLSYRIARFWKGNEIKIIQEMYSHKTAQEIGEIIGRSEKAVRGKIGQLGLKKKVLVKK